jgi:hypothetical protein
MTYAALTKPFLILPFVLTAAACETTTGTTTLAGAAAGATIGGAAAGTSGAIVGGAAGAVAGNLIGQAITPGDCVYVDRFGRRFIAECPH